MSIVNLQIYIGIIAIRVYVYTWRMYGEGRFRGGKNLLIFKKL